MTISFHDIPKMVQLHTRKMILKAPIGQILKAECNMYGFNSYFHSVEVLRCFFCFKAIAKNLYNILMLKHNEFIKLISELPDSKIWIVIRKSKPLHSNNLFGFSNSLLKKRMLSVLPVKEKNEKCKLLVLRFAR